MLLLSPLPMAVTISAFICPCLLAATYPVWR